MNYETKKSSGNYLGINSGLKNKIVAGLTGLSLLVSGCVDSINGIRIRAQNDNGYKGEVINPLGKKKEKKDDNTNYFIVGGLILGGAAIGTGIYFLGEDQKWWGDHDNRRAPGSTFGGGENGGGPGGQ